MTVLFFSDMVDFSIFNERSFCYLPMRKVFCIGLNKTGTSTLHTTVASHGVRSTHATQWALVSRLKAFEAYVDQHGKPPPADHPGSRWGTNEPFHQWQNFDFYSDSLRPRFDLLDRLFPGSFFILNTRSLYGWLTSKYNKAVRNRRDAVRYPIDPAIPDVMEIRQLIVEREEYYRTVFEYFKGRDDFAVVNVEADDESTLLTLLSTVTGRPIKRLVTRHVHKNSAEYERHPAAVEAALERQNIPPDEWYRTLL